MSSTEDDYRTSQDKQVPDSSIRTEQKRKRYDQKYNGKWENIYSWIRKSKKSELHFNCKICNADYMGGKTEIKRHEASQKHIVISQSTQKQRTLEDSVSRSNNFENQVKEAEVRVAAFIVEHNLSFNISDHLSELIKSCSPDSRISKPLACGRTKCTGIVKNVTGCFSSEAL